MLFVYAVNHADWIRSGTPPRARATPTPARACGSLPRILRAGTHRHAPEPGSRPLRPLGARHRRARPARAGTCRRPRASPAPLPLRPGRSRRCWGRCSAGIRARSQRATPRATAGSRPHQREQTVVRVPKVAVVAELDGLTTRQLAHGERCRAVGDAGAFLSGVSMLRNRMRSSAPPTVATIVSPSATRTTTPSAAGATAAADETTVGTSDEAASRASSESARTEVRTGLGREGTGVPFE